MFPSKQISTCTEEDDVFLAQANGRTIKWTVEQMKLEHIDKCLDIWKQVELTEAKCTVAATLITDPQGMFVALLEPNKEVIGMCSAVITRQDTAFIGFYAVEPKYQSFGIGKSVWSRTLKRFEATQTNIGLYGVPSMSEKYRSKGFKVEDTVQMLIFESKREDLPQDSLLKYANLKQYITLSTSILESTYDTRIMFLDNNSNEQNDGIVDKIIDYDATVNEFSRKILLDIYLRAQVADGNFKMPITCALLRNDNQKVVAYGCLREDNTNGAMLGPLYASCSGYAELIMVNLLLKYLDPIGKQAEEIKQFDKSSILSVMSLTGNVYALELANKFGLKQVEYCTRMFTKTTPQANFSHIYYVHSPNFSLF